MRAKTPRSSRWTELHHILGEMLIAADLPLRDGINQVEMPPHQFRESFFGAIFGIAAEQFGVIDHDLA